MPSSAPLPTALHPFPTRRSSDLDRVTPTPCRQLPAMSADTANPRTTRLLLRETPTTKRRPPPNAAHHQAPPTTKRRPPPNAADGRRSEEHTSELQSLRHLVCRLLPHYPQPSTPSLHDALPISTG